MNQIQPQNGELFFEHMNKQISEFQERLQNWKQENPQKFDFVKNLIEKEFAELQNLKKYINEVKIYITFMGTLSAGKSTFINSLLGQQLLPSRAQECTKQFLFITYGEKIKINDSEYETLEEATQILLKMQSDQKFNRVDISTNSLFHKEFPSDLRNRIFFVDTPGVKTGEDELDNPQLRLDEILDDREMCINLWVSDYQHFDNDKKKIFYLLQGMSQDFFFQKNEMHDQNEYLDKLFFVLNKIDTRKKSEDKNIDEVIKEICQKVGDDHFVYRISSLRALQYQILNFGDQLAREKFIKSYYEDYKDDYGFENIDQCKVHCDKTIKNNKQYMNNQQYPLIYEQLKEQIVQKITIGFNNILQQVISYDSYLKIIFSNDKQFKIESDEDKEVVKILMARQLNLILQYQQDVQQYQRSSIFKLSQLIRENQNDLEQREINDVLRNVCKKTLDLQSEIKQDIQKLNKNYKQDILNQINQIQCEIKSKLQEECRNMQSSFSDAQAMNLFNQNKEQMEKDFCENLGIKFIRTPTLARIALCIFAYSQVEKISQSIINNSLKEASKRFIFYAGALILSRLNITTTLGYISKEIAKEKLNQFEEARKNQIIQLCYNLINTNEQTLRGLQFIFNQLIDA